MLNLLRLEHALDDKTARAVDRTGRTHFGKHELDDVLRLSVHTLADFGDVGEDGLLVSFAQHLRWRDGVTLACRIPQRWVCRVQLGVEAIEELRRRAISVKN